MIFSVFRDHPELIAGTTSRCFGTFSRTIPDVHHLNCHKIQSYLGCDDLFISLNGHTSRIINPLKDDLNNPHDGFITNRMNICLGVLTADCVPIFFYSPKDKVIGIVHSGWKGIKYHIVEKTIDKLRDDFNVQAKNLFVAMGPHIYSCCYTVGMDVLTHIEGALDFSCHTLHMQAIIINVLRRCGVLDCSIYSTSYCTFCSTSPGGDRLFFSHRHHDCERMLSFIVLQD